MSPLCLFDTAVDEGTTILKCSLVAPLCSGNFVFHLCFEQRLTQYLLGVALPNSLFIQENSVIIGCLIVLP
ncbi:hypothetical protein CsatB_008687 [Cannabis sativa]